MPLLAAMFGIVSFPDSHSVSDYVSEFLLVGRVSDYTFVDSFVPALVLLVIHNKFNK